VDADHNVGRRDEQEWYRRRVGPGARDGQHLHDQRVVAEAHERRGVRGHRRHVVSAQTQCVRDLAERPARVRLGHEIDPQEPGDP